MGILSSTSRPAMDSDTSDTPWSITLPTAALVGSLTRDTVAWLLLPSAVTLVSLEVGGSADHSTAHLVGRGEEQGAAPGHRAVTQARHRSWSQGKQLYLGKHGSRLGPPAPVGARVGQVLAPGWAGQQAGVTPEHRGTCLGAGRARLGKAGQGWARLGKAE